MGIVRTSCALLLRAEIDLSASGDPALEAAFHRVLLIDPLHLHPRPTCAADTGRRRAVKFVDGAPRGRGRGELAKVVEQSDAEHAVFGAVGILGAPATCVVLEIEHDVAWGGRGARGLGLFEVRTRIGDGGDESL
jgi:hypothetical protein